MSSSGDGKESSPPANSRRERGKLAQRAYRKRHASKFQGLQEENRQLREAIRGISAVVGHDSRATRWPELAAAVAQARETAGLEKVSTTFQQETESQDGSAGSDAVVGPPRNQPQPRQLHPGHGHTFTRVPSSDSANGWEPWLDPDPMVKLPTPPDILPFLGPGMATLAGCLYWACTHITVGLWQQSEDGDTSDANQRALNSIFSRTEEGFSDRGFLMTLAKARLDIARNGSTSVRSSDQREMNLAIEDMHARMDEENERQGLRKEWWRTPQEVEEYARQRMEPHEYARVQLSVENGGPRHLIKALADFLGIMGKNYKCFGGGPRWNVTFASMAVGILIKKFRGDKEGYLPGTVIEPELSVEG